MNTMKRRDFLGLGAGFLSLPLTGAVTNSIDRMAPLSGVVVQPWNKGLLRPVELNLDVDASAPFRVVHISDTHINFSDIEELYASERNYAAGVRRYTRFPQAVPSLYAVFDYVAARPGTLLVHTGDLIDFGTRASYSFLRHNFTGRDMIFAMGNHEYENPDSSYDTDLDYRRRRLNESGVYGNLECSSRIVNGVNFVSFDSAVAGKGVIPPAVRSAIEREFAKKMPVVLLCHIPPYLSVSFRESAAQGKADLALQRGLPKSAERFLSAEWSPLWTGDAETVAFWRRIRELENFKAVLCGHCHWPWSEPFGCGMLCMAGGNYEGCLNDIMFS